MSKYAKGVFHKKPNKFVPRCFLKHIFNDEQILVALSKSSDQLESGLRTSEGVSGTGTFLTDLLGTVGCGLPKNVVDGATAEWGGSCRGNMLPCLGCNWGEKKHFWLELNVKIRLILMTG